MSNNRQNDQSKNNLTDNPKPTDTNGVDDYNLDNNTNQQITGGSRHRKRKLDYRNYAVKRLELQKLNAVSMVNESGKIVSGLIDTVYNNPIIDNQMFVTEKKVQYEPIDFKTGFTDTANPNYTNTVITPDTIKVDPLRLSQATNVASSIFVRLSLDLVKVDRVDFNKSKDGICIRVVGACPSAVPCSNVTQCEIVLTEKVSSVRCLQDGCGPGLQSEGYRVCNKGIKDLVKDYDGVSSKQQVKTYLKENVTSSDVDIAVNDSFYEFTTTKPYKPGFLHSTLQSDPLNHRVSIDNHQVRANDGYSWVVPSFRQSSIFRELNQVFNFDSLTHMTFNINNYYNQPNHVLATKSAIQEELKISTNIVLKQEFIENWYKTSEIRLSPGIKRDALLKFLLIQTDFTFFDLLIAFDYYVNVIFVDDNYYQWNPYDKRWSKWVTKGSLQSDISDKAVSIIAYIQQNILPDNLNKTIKEVLTTYELYIGKQHNLTSFSKYFTIKFTNLCKDLKIKFDNVDFLLPFNNVIYDLNLDRVREYTKTDYICKRFDFNYDGTVYDTDCLSYLNDLFPDPIEYKKMICLLRYFIDGRLKNDVIIFALGSGANGKSLFVWFIKHVFGPFIESVQPSFFITNTNSNVPRPDILSLKGAKVGIVSEPSNEAIKSCLLKSYSGFDSHKHRELHSNTYTDFIIKTKFLVVANSFPPIKVEGIATTRRIAILNFTTQFKRDTSNEEDDVEYRFVERENIKFAIEDLQNKFKADDRWRQTLVNLGLKEPSKGVCAYLIKNTDRQVYKSTLSAMDILKKIAFLKFCKTHICFDENSIMTSREVICSFDNSLKGGTSSKMYRLYVSWIKDYILNTYPLLKIQYSTYYTNIETHEGLTIKGNKKGWKGLKLTLDNEQLKRNFNNAESDDE